MDAVDLAVWVGAPAAETEVPRVELGVPSLPVG
jgi:hypothetical protein